MKSRRIIWTLIVATVLVSIGLGVVSDMPEKRAFGLFGSARGVIGKEMCFAESSETPGTTCFRAVFVHRDRYDTIIVEAEAPFALHIDERYTADRANFHLRNGREGWYITYHCSASECARHRGGGTATYRVYPARKGKDL